MSYVERIQGTGTEEDSGPRRRGDPGDDDRRDPRGDRGDAPEGAGARRRFRACRLFRLCRRHEHGGHHRDVHFSGDAHGEISDFYINSGKEMFDKAFILKRFRYNTRTTSLQRSSGRSSVQDTTFGSDKLKTLLLIVMRNATTDSPWPLSNNPGAKYNDPGEAIAI